MNPRIKLSLALAFCGGVGASNAVTAGCPAVPTLPTPSATNSVTLGDGVSYSLPFLGLNVQSLPGQIDDCIVVAAGSNGNPVTTTFAGMDNAYATPNGPNSNPYFRIGDPTNSPDPGSTGQFAGDSAPTWDTRLLALNTYLAGNDMVVYFNHNQINSGSGIDQDLFISAQVALIDNAGVLPTVSYYFTSAPSRTGPQNFGAPGGNPALYTGPRTPATCTYPTGADSPCTFRHSGVGTGTERRRHVHVARARWGVPRRPRWLGQYRSV